MDETKVRKTDLSYSLFHCIPKDVKLKIASLLTFDDEISFSSVDKEMRCIIKDRYINIITNTTDFSSDMFKVDEEKNITVSRYLYEVIAPFLVAEVHPTILNAHNAMADNREEKTRVELSPILLYRFIKCKSRDSFVGDKLSCLAGRKLIPVNGFFWIHDQDDQTRTQINIRYVYDMNKPLIHPVLSDYFKNSGCMSLGTGLLLDETSAINSELDSIPKYRGKIPPRIIHKTSSIPAVIYELGLIEYRKVVKNGVILGYGLKSSNMLTMGDGSRPDKMIKYANFSEHTFVFIFGHDKETLIHVFLFEF